MLLARIFLALQALLLSVVGLAYLTRPYELANLSGMLLMAPAALSDVRAYYGGLKLALATYLLLGMARLDLLRPALMLLVLLYTALALARVSGLGLDGGLQQTFNLYFMLFEFVSAGLAFWCLRGLER